LLGVSRPTGSDLDEDLKFVEPRDLANLRPSSLLTVGSHAMTHRDLPTLSYDEQVGELRESDLLLREHCPSYCPVVAYPSGSFNSDTLKIARRIYDAGFATFLGSYSDVYGYRRICLGQDSIHGVAYAIGPTRLNYVLPLKRYLHLAGIRV
jgi:peptidoglycan/xylan/chitin deacetylase (PgdA/CDA1 family)